MSLLGTKAGDAYLINLWLGNVSATKFKLHLSSNARTPTYDDTPASWTELSVAGYAALDLLFSAASVITADPFSFALWAAQSWTFTAACAPTGYWISDNGNTVVIAAEELLPTPPSYGSTGGPLSLTPQLGLQ